MDLRVWPAMVAWPHPGSVATAVMVLTEGMAVPVAMFLVGQLEPMEATVAARPPDQQLDWPAGCRTALTAAMVATVVTAAMVGPEVRALLALQEAMAATVAARVRPATVVQALHRGWQVLMGVMAEMAVILVRPAPVVPVARAAVARPEQRATAVLR